MSKVIAIIDKPENCQKCWFSMCQYSLPLSTYRKGYSCRIQEPSERVVEDFDYDEEVHLQNCPLREIPKKQPLLNYPEYRENDYSYGFNACLDDIYRR